MLADAAPRSLQSQAQPSSLKIPPRSHNSAMSQQQHLVLRCWFSPHDPNVVGAPPGQALAANAVSLGEAEGRLEAHGQGRTALHNQLLLLG